MKEGWRYKRIGEITNLITDGDWIESRHQSDNGFRLIQTGNIGCGIFKAKDDKPHFISETTFKELSCTEIFEGDCLISRLPDPVGRSCLIPNIGNRMITAVDCTILRFKKEVIPSYFVYYTQSNRYSKEIEGNVTGATRKRISRKNLEKIQVPVPPLLEQQHIVEELDLLSSIIEKKKAQLFELDNLAQSLFYEMFGHLYETAFPIKPLIDICEFIKDGTHQTPTYTDDKVNGVKFLSAKDVVSGYINWENIKLIPFELHQELHKRIAPQRNDLLLCKNGTTGICAIVETDEIFDIYVSLALLRPRKPFCPKYLLYAINNPQTKRQFDESLKGIGVPNLHLGEIKKTKIVFPPLELQQQFAEKVESIEHQKELIKQSIKEVETLFNSRMDYYFN